MLKFITVPQMHVGHSLSFLRKSIKIYKVFTFGNHYNGQINCLSAAESCASEIKRLY